MTYKNSGTDFKRVVVGIDGSANSSAALHWAWEFSKKQGAQLEVLYLAAPCVARPMERMWIASAPRHLQLLMMGVQRGR